MTIQTKAEILEILQMPFEEFNDTIKQEAKNIHKTVNDDSVIITSLFGYDNICRNQCTYCGMRAGNADLQRFRISLADAKKTIDAAKKLGLGRLFLISGEDPKYSFDDILSMVNYGKSQGLFMSLAAGEYGPDKYIALKEAGLDEYVLKFETSSEEMFARIKPSTSFSKRMKAIEHIKSSGMRLGSGNIIGLPHQTLEQVANDIALMKELEISWAPIIPYMPVPNTPLASEGGRGSLETTVKEISILRLMMPSVNITAQQPGKDMKKGLADPEGNLNALKAGANMLFVDMLPKPLAENFNVIDNRRIEGLEKVEHLVAQSGMIRSIITHR